jgi:hypothetical protein
MDSQRLVALVAIIIIEFPLIILLWVLIKTTQTIIIKTKSLNYEEDSWEKDNNNLRKLIIAIILLTLFVLFFIIIMTVPDFILVIPSSWKIFILFFIIIVYFPIYFCFMGFFRGLGNVVGAGGSAYNVIKQLKSYIYDALECNQEKKDNNIKK